MKGASPEQSAWVQRVLGFRLQAAGGAAAGWKAAIAQWRDANDAVNGQINGLRAALLDRVNAGSPGVLAYAAALRRVAEHGLNAVTENHHVSLMAAVMELGDGAPATIAKSGAKALAAITEFQSLLAGSRKIAVCDANPFGAPVAIRATLGPALQKMADALATAAAP